MATFRITAPDGRVFQIVGDRTPTAEDLSQMFQDNLPDYQTKEETFDWSKVTPEMREQIAANNRDYDNQSYAGRMAKDAIIGYAEGLENLTNRAVNGATLGGFDLLDRKGGGEAARLRNSIHQNVNNEVGTAGNVLLGAGELGSEIAGNIYGAGGAITKGVMKGTAALSKAGVPVVSKVAGGTFTPMLADASLQGSIYGATESDSLDELAGNTARGAVVGGVTGAALGGVVKALGRFGGLFRKDPQKGMDYLRKQLGDEAVDALIQEAKDKKLSILEVVDEKGLDIAQMARQQTPEAKYTIAKNLREMDSQNTQNTQKFFDDMFGQRSGYETVDDIAQVAKQEAQPLYNELESMGDLAAYETKDIPQKNFEKWFEGSKVVDENGLPLTVYHGTRADFDAFDINKAGQSNGDISKIGFWLTPEKEIASDFSNSWYGGENPKILSNYVNFKNPKVYRKVDNTEALKNIKNEIKNTKENMQKIRDSYYKNMNELRYYTESDDFYDIAKMKGFKKEEADAAKQYWDYDKKLDDLLFEERSLKANDAYDQLLNDLDEYSKFIQHIDGVKDYKRGSHVINIARTNRDEAVAKLKERLKKEGYDSIIVENTNRDADVIGKNASQYIAFEPNQIKSVNNSGAWSSSPSLSDAGWKPESKIARIVKENDVIADTIKGVKRSLSSLKKASDTDARVILETRKVLSKQTKSSDPSVAYQARNALKELDPVLKDVFGGKLEQANKIYEDAYKFQDAFDFGKNKVINQETSPQVFAREFDKLTDKEKKAVELGLKEKMLQITQGRTQEGGWKLSPFAQQKIRRVLGEKEGGRLIDYANARMKAAQNRNAARGGSTTAQNQKLRDDVNFAVDALSNPTGIVGKVLKRVPWNDARNRGIADILTNPDVGYVEAFYQNSRNPQGWEAVYEALMNPNSKQAKYNAALSAYLTGQALKD